MFPLYHGAQGLSTHDAFIEGSFAHFSQTTVCSASFSRSEDEDLGARSGVCVLCVKLFKFGRITRLLFNLLNRTVS